jgi:hypothetical protein
VSAGASSAADGSHPGDPARTALDSRSAHILTFERRWLRQAGAKEEAIRAEFGLSAARYYQMLNSVLDDPQALAFDPMLVKRLLRIRDARTEARSARILGRPDSH